MWLDSHSDLKISDCLDIFVKWLSSSDQAVELLESLGSEDSSALDAFLALARFADSQYQTIVTYTKSSTYESKQALIKQAKQHLEALTMIGDKPGDR